MCCDSQLASHSSRKHGMHCGPHVHSCESHMHQSADANEMLQSMMSVAHSMHVFYVMYCA